MIVPVKSFTRTVSGFCTEGIALALLVVIIGCASPSGSGTPPSSGSGTPPSSSTASLSPNGATNVYVSEQPVCNCPKSILQFTATSNGSILPNSTLTTLTTLPLPLPSGLATDSSGSIYVGAFSQTGPEVLVYSAGSSGTASPTRTILASTASLFDPWYIAVDSSAQLYVLDPTGSVTLGSNGGVFVFASSANGAATPIRHIQGSLTQLDTSGIPNAISVDASGNIYVSLAPPAGTISVSTLTILVFSANQNGNVAPARVITATSPTPLVDPFAYALDTSGDFYVTYSGAGGVAITKFASNGSSTATPVKTISGSATGLGAVLALRVDAAGNIFTLNLGASGLSVDAFGASGSGNLAPAVHFTSTSLNQVLSQLAVN